MKSIIRWMMPAGLLLLALSVSAQDVAEDASCRPDGIAAQVSVASQAFAGTEPTVSMEYIYDDLDTLRGALDALVSKCEDARYQAYAEEGTTLLEALRGGGYVIYVRHTRTDRSQEDTDLTSCETQRNLTERGRTDATRIGEAWSTLGVPVGRLISTEYCRTRETAQLAFGEPTIIPRAEMETSLDELLAEMPDAGMNTIIVGHVDLLEAVTGIQVPEEARLNEGDALVYRPLGGAMGDGGYQLAARISFRNWGDLARIAAENGMS